MSNKEATVYTLSNNRSAISYMLLCVFGYSFVPISIMMVGGTTAPFLLAASQAIGHIVGGACLLRMRYPAQSRDSRIWQTVRDNVCSSAVLFAALAPFAFAFLAWATAYIDAAVATIIWGSWPIFVVMFLARRPRSEDLAAHYDISARGRRHLTISLFVLMVLGLAGLSFIVLSSTDAVVDISGLSSGVSLMGLMIAVASAWLASLTAWHFRWADLLVGQLDEDTVSSFRARGRKTSDLDKAQNEARLFFVVVCFMIGNVIALPVLAGIGTVSAEPLSPAVVFGGLAIGLLILTPAAVLWRLSNLVTHNYGVNSLNYFEPLLALLWLGLWWDIEILRTDYMILGATAVVAANILINTAIEIGPSFKASIIVLWISGTVIYFRDDKIVWHDDGYFGILALSMTIFALILAFRIIRIGLIVNADDQRFLRLVHQIEFLSVRGILDDNSRTLFGDLCTLDVAGRSSVAAKPYSRLMRAIDQARSRFDRSDRERSDLATLERDLNVFVNSRQQTWGSGEFVPLCVFALTTVSLALFGRHSGHGHAAYLTDVFTVALCGVVAFLVFMSWDLERNRQRPVLRELEGRQALYFPHLKYRRVEQLIVLSIAAGVWVTFAYLLKVSWL